MDRGRGTRCTASRLCLSGGGAFFDFFLPLRATTSTKSARGRLIGLGAGGAASMPKQARSTTTSRIGRHPGLVVPQRRKLESSVFPSNNFTTNRRQPPHDRKRITAARELHQHAKHLARTYGPRFPRRSSGLSAVPTSGRPSRARCRKGRPRTRYPPKR